MGRQIKARSARNGEGTGKKGQARLMYKLIQGPNREPWREPSPGGSRAVKEQSLSVEESRTKPEETIGSPQKCR